MWVFGIFGVLFVALATYSTYSWYMTGSTPLDIPLPVAKADARINEAPVTAEQVNTHEVGPLEPRYISIPSLGVSKARVMNVGLTDTNHLDVPQNIHDAGWFNKSATPGSGFGAVVIDGHSVGINENGVFIDLHKLQKGQLITIERGDGQQISYEVADNRTMSLDEANETGMQSMMSSADSSKEGLSLITCAGTWVPRMNMFDQRVMLRAVAIDQ
jgi:LPXTG-site transpeptidase (sortase) family protein